MSGQPVTRWRYGARHSTGAWHWPAAAWEYDVEAAKSKCCVRFPFQHIVGVEPLPPESGQRLIHELGRGWRPDNLPPRGSGEAGVPPSIDEQDADYWWKDRD